MKLKNKKIICGIILLLFIITIGLIMPMLGRVSSSVMKKLRIMNLQRWHERVRLYTDEKSRLPNSLYDAYYGLNIRYSSMLLNPENKEKINSEIYPNDPNAFCAAIDYVFIIIDDDWIVKESKLYKGNTFLCIDSSGTISESNGKMLQK